MAGWLEQNCPWLHRAHHAQLRVLEERAQRAARKRYDLGRLEWLVAHRELQYQRAAAVGRRGYLAERARKLEQAQRALAHVKADLANVGSWEPKWAV